MSEYLWLSDLSENREVLNLPFIELNPKKQSTYNKIQNPRCDLLHIAMALIWIRSFWRSVSGLEEGLLLAGLNALFSLG